MLEIITHTALDPYTGLPITVKYTANLPKSVGGVPDPLDTTGSPMSVELFGSLSGQTLPSDSEKNNNANLAAPA